VNTSLAKEFWDEMDSLENYPSDFSGSPLTGVAVLRIIADYASVAHKCSWPPEGTSLAVVVWPPEVYFCPSPYGAHGAFVEPYDPLKYGEYARKITKSMNIWEYTNIDAMRDGWDFNAGMISLANNLKDKP
jgi:hypothetical protein